MIEAKGFNDFIYGVELKLVDGDKWVPVIEFRDGVTKGQTILEALERLKKL